MAGGARQAGDADSSWAPGLTSCLQGSMNVHRGALLLVSQWQCISSFVFYIMYFKIKKLCEMEENLLKKNPMQMNAYILWRFFVRIVHGHIFNIHVYIQVAGLNPERSGVSSSLSLLVYLSRRLKCKNYYDCFDCTYQEKREEIWRSRIRYDKHTLRNERQYRSNFHEEATKPFDFTKFSDRLMTVTWSENIHWCQRALALFSKKVWVNKQPGLTLTLFWKFSEENRLQM